MKEITVCPICGSPRNSFKPLYLLSDSMHDISGRYQIVKCENCSLFLINPQPTGEELNRHYPAEYYSFRASPPRYYGKSLIEKLGAALRHPLYTVAVILELPLRRREIFQHNTRLLDIGCGQGEYLQRLRIKNQYNMQLYGVDVGGVDEERMRKQSIKFFKGDLAEAKFKDAFFDVVTINHALEHVEDPVRVLREINRILKKTGKLIIGIPNTGSATYFLFRENSVQLDVPRHLFGYSVRNIRMLAKKTGFEVTHVRYNSLPYQLLGSLEYFLNKFRKDRVFLSGSKLVNSSFLKLLVYPLCRLFDILRIGDQVEIVLGRDNKI